jgi:hypothetical protein
MRANIGKHAVTTQTLLLNAYRARLIADHAWAKDEARLARYMISVQRTLQGENTIDRTGESFRAACHDVGLSPRITLKALHALPR